ncbi:UvrD-helicase domain-containing protein [Streptomyces laurentii]|uniref:UvrD-helicase domain-containing protein n=1 Tax=Streptomyces laurentii TaxID=39478 RepID=UPI00369FAF5D
MQICAEAHRLLASHDSVAPYRHVVIDEAQDLHPAQWRFLRALVPEGNDDLFIAGDAHQRIYGNRVSLRSLGINVTGRSHRLRINYRTTQEILHWSTALANPPARTSAAEDAENEETLTGYRSTLHGRRPTLEFHSTKLAEMEAAVDQDPGLDRLGSCAAGRSCRCALHAARP